MSQLDYYCVFSECHGIDKTVLILFSPYTVQVMGGVM